MATCERIAQLLQAYLDGELAPWERLMVEHHVQDCVICQEELRDITSCSATLFESFDPYKLTDGFRDRVLNRLPGKGAVPFWTRHSGTGHRRTNRRAELVSRSMLAGAVAVLVIALVIIVYNYPAPLLPAPEEIGIVSGVEGSVTIARGYEDTTRETVLRDVVFQADRLVTGENGRLVLALKGPTEIKMNTNTELWTDNERFIRLVKGEILGHVTGENGLFKVQTPNGDINVTGTEFNIRASSDQTMVAVTEGTLVAATPLGFTQVSAGQVSALKSGSVPEQVRQVAATELTKWARDLFPQTVDIRYSPAAQLDGQVGVYVYMFRPEGVTRVMDILVRRDAYGTAPLSLPGNAVVNLYNHRWEKLASRTLSLNNFTGTNTRVSANFSRDNVVVDRPFYALLIPSAEALESFRVRPDISDVITYTSEGG